MSGGHAPETSHKGIALLIAVVALFLAFSELGANHAEKEMTAANIEASNLWAFFQAKAIRRTNIQVAAEQMETTLPTVTDSAQKSVLEKRIADWRATAERYASEPSTGEGQKELAARAKKSEERREVMKARNELFEIASAILQIAIVLASAMIITGTIALAWLAAGISVGALGLMALAIFAPSVVHYII